MKVFPDTNVWLSGLLGNGLCSRLLDELVLHDCDIVVGEAVLAEFSRIATEKFHIPHAQLKHAQAFMGSWTVVPVQIISLPDCPDVDDLPILGSALHAGCSHFVTGDRALLSMQQIEQMSIVSPRQMLMQLLRDSGS